MCYSGESGSAREGGQFATQGLAAIPNREVIVVRRTPPLVLAGGGGIARVARSRGDCRSVAMAAQWASGGRPPASRSVEGNLFGRLDLESGQRLRKGRCYAPRAS